MAKSSPTFLLDGSQTWVIRPSRPSARLAGNYAASLMLEAPAIVTGRQASGFSEAAREVTLIGESGFVRDLREAPARGAQEASGSFNPHGAQVGRWRDAKQFLEAPFETTRVKSASWSKHTKQTPQVTRRRRCVRVIFPA